MLSGGNCPSSLKPCRKPLARWRISPPSAPRSTVTLSAAVAAEMQISRQPNQAGHRLKMGTGTSPSRVSEALRVNRLGASPRFETMPQAAVVRAWKFLDGMMLLLECRGNGRVWINGLVIEGSKGRPEAPKAETYGANSITWAGKAGLGWRATTAPRLLRRHDDLEGRALDLAQLLVQHGDPRVGGDGNRPVDAVVGHEHAVLLQALEDRLDLGREAGDVEVLAQADAARPSAGGSRSCAGWRSAWPGRRTPGGSSPRSRAWRARRCPRFSSS